VQADGLEHFVTVKGPESSYVSLQATVEPNTTDVKDTVSWWTEDESKPLYNPPTGSNDYTLVDFDRGQAMRIPLKVLLGPTTARRCVAWVVWAATDIGATRTIVVQPSSSSCPIYGGYTFHHTISPDSILDTTEDVPNLSTAHSNPPAVPNEEGVMYKGQVLEGGVTARWDISRDARQKIINPSNIPFTTDGLHGAFSYTSYLNWPTESAAGNDDPFAAYEDNNPYEDPDQGKLTAIDHPLLRPWNCEGSVGDTFEKRLHCKEFSRLQIGSTWYRISSSQAWRIHFKFKKEATGTVVTIIRPGINTNLETKKRGDDVIKYGTIWPGINHAIDSVAKDTDGDGDVDGDDGPSDDVGCKEKWVNDGSSIGTNHTGWE